MKLQNLLSQFDDEEALVIMREGTRWQAGTGEEQGRSGWVSGACETLEEALETLAEKREQTPRENHD